MKSLKIRTASALCLLALLSALSGCRETVVAPPAGNGLKVQLSAQAAAVDHGWLVVDGDTAHRFAMARVGNFLESAPIVIQPGLRLFEITAVDAQENPLFYGRYSGEVGQGDVALELDIVLRRVAPMCTVSADTLEFGIIETGSSGLDTLTVGNAPEALGDLQVEAVPDCAAFQVIAGGGPRTLAPGSELEIVVEFLPTASGPTTCGLTLGPDCPLVTLTGVGESPAACGLSASALGFGEVMVGESAEKSFTVSNKGGGVLEGSIAAQGCDGFTVVSGAGGFALSAGETRTVTVEFAPEGEGVQSCSIATGTGCGTVAINGTGVLDPVCELSAASLDFGDVMVGESVQKSFTVMNTGGGALSGSIQLDDCGAFTIVSGGGDFDLTAGESHTVTVEFAPGGEGPQSCSIATGTDCGTVSVQGTGVLDPVCELNTESLDFGDVMVGESAQQNFTVSNIGGGVLEGIIAAQGCVGFTVVSGGGSFSLTAGQSRTVTVKFAPGSEGPQSCSIATGTDCGTVSVQGTGVLDPVCELNTESLDFGDVMIGEFTEKSFTVSNTGGGILEGNIATQNCGDFTVVEGGGAFALTAGQSRTVTVEFAPEGEGPQSCSIATGTDCGTVAVSGTGVLDPECDLSAASLDFGGVLVGESARSSVTVTNTGGGALTGTIRLDDCDGFIIVSGGGQYELTAGQTRTVDIVFAPASGGDFACTLMTGTDCGDVALSGAGLLPPACELSAASLDFGEMMIGESAQQSFTVTNTGGGVLEGSIAAQNCGDFTVVEGGGGFALAAGKSRTVTVEFAPQAEGPQICSIATGTGCGAVTVNGVGVAPPVTELFDPAALDFGEVTVGTTKDLSFTVTNIFPETMRGHIRDNCHQYDIMSGGGDFVLAPQESLVVVVRFAPTRIGLDTCRIKFEADKCGDDEWTVPLSGVGVSAP